MSTLALDPGLRGCGVAVFSDAGVLVECEYVRSGSKDADLEGALWMARAVEQAFPPPYKHLAVEWPQVYAGSKQKGDANDLIALAAVVAAVCTRYSTSIVTRYKPRDWKGQVPKEVIQARILGSLGVAGRLSPDEMLVYANCDCSKSLRHNILDAIGIGLHFLDRL
jgi:hypothetical protein